MPAADLERAQLAAEMAARDLLSARFAATVAAAEAETADHLLARVGNAGADRDVDVAAPIAGRVLRVGVESEGVVGPGTPLVELGDPSRLEIVVDVLTADAVAIVPGAPVVIDGWGGALLAGRVRRIEPSATTRVSALGVEEQRVDVIVDLVESGRTLEENGLEVREEVLAVSSQLVANRAAFKWKGEHVAPLIERLRRAVGQPR